MFSDVREAAKDEHLVAAYTLSATGQPAHEFQRHTCGVGGASAVISSAAAGSGGDTKGERSTSGSPPADRDAPCANARCVAHERVVLGSSLHQG